MQLTDNSLLLAATDLSTFLSCQHCTALDLAAATGSLVKPPARFDMAIRLLRQRGTEHELAYVEHLRGQGLQVVEIPSKEKESPDRRVAATTAALQSGADVVYQGVFAGDGWFGIADILRKVPCPPGAPSKLGDFQYEPYDTKLARETRGGTILQLALYADLLAEVQGVAPQRFFVVTPGADPFAIHEYRLADYAAYFRMIRANMLAVIAQGADAAIAQSYPEPTEHCDVCRWWERCEKRRRSDDHLSFIAGAGRSQRTELAAQNVPTLAAAAALPVPVAFKPSRGSRETFNRIGEQAQVQLEQRTRNAPVFRVLPVTAGQGLCRLPAPSCGDLFLDLEGARFVQEGGHEYLFGLGEIGADGAFVYRCWWAMDAPAEKLAFEQLMDAIVAARAADPDLHVYHFAPYEPTALKRLAGRHATRQDVLDDLLRAECFVDLYAAVRQAVRAGVESYSIKQLEQYYGFERAVALRDASAERLAVEMVLEARSPDSLGEGTREIVEGYNRDDVVSTQRLRDWLEGLRAAQVAAGVEVPRPAPEPEEEKKGKGAERTAAATALREKILDGVPPEASDPAHPDHVRWLLAYLIDAHHREERAAWWEYFRLREMPAEDLLDEAKAIARLEHVAVVGPFLGKKGKPTGSMIHRYQFPLQEVELSEGDNLQRQDGLPFGELMVLDRAARTIEVKRSKNSGEDHPASAFALDVITTERLQKSVMRFAERMHAAGYEEESAAADLIARRGPRLRAGQLAPGGGESTKDFAVRIVTELDRTTLAIQGPPGAGKTHVGASMIRAAVAAGKRVGVTSNSHKVIQNLFDEIYEQAGAAQQDLRFGRKPSPDEVVPSWVASYDKNEEALAAIRSGEVHVLGGTAWLWADQDAAGVVDLLFVDEAGQFSLANTLAIAQAVGSLVLLGDPQQLDQPRKASHPDGVGVSALTHVLGEHETMPPGRGIFMPETWRLAPAVCEFTSELFYEGKLRSIPPLSGQRLVGTNAFDGAGLWWMPVEHTGNRSSSDEEVEAVARLVEKLIGAKWVDEDGELQELKPGDLRIVAPYNAQVNRLAARLDARFAPEEIPVGTVDKFQGQTCAVVIYSMATSRPEDAPRGMEFLYSLNRLNVATSRARCAAFIVASPALMEPQCRTPRQMQLANGLCRFVEMARRG